MSFDGFVTTVVVHQLQNLVGGRVDKIYQPEFDELIFLVHSAGKNHRLYISVNGGNARIHLFKNDYKNPQNPTAFCMLLRKHFQGGRIIKIQQIESERIVEIYIDHINELGVSDKKKLIIEIMGKHSNIIALNLNTEKIIDSIKRISIDVNRHRQILPGNIYVFPPSHGKIPYYTVTEDHISSFFQRFGKGPEALVKGIQGMSPTLADEIFNRAVQSQGIPIENITADKIYPTFKKLINDIQSDDLSAIVYLKEGKPKDFHVFKLSAYKDMYDEKSFGNISEAIEYYFSNKEDVNRLNQKSQDIKKVIQNRLEKLYLKKQRLAEDLFKAKNSGHYRLYGELLTANIYAINKQSDRAEVFNYYTGKNEIIPLDPRFSLAKNAQRYFKKYSKAKTAVKEIGLQLKETNDTIDYLESVLTFAENATTVDEIEELRLELIEGGFLRHKKNVYKTPKAKLQPLIYTSNDGFRIMAGRNNKENDRLTFKSADKKDIWFHTKGIPGSHVILNTEGKKPSDEAITKAASIAAYHSKARLSENVAVDYTLVKYVKKYPGARPGMVIYTNYHTLFVKPNIKD